jgi:hypothetical protein
MIPVHPWKQPAASEVDVTDQILIRLYDSNPTEAMSVITEAAAESDLSPEIQPYGLRSVTQEATMIVFATAAGTILGELATDRLRSLRRSISSMLTRLAAHRIERIADSDVTLKLKDADLLLKPSQANEALGASLDRFIAAELANLQGDKSRLVWDETTKTWKVDGGP